MNGVSPSTRRFLAFLAGALFLIAVVWLILLESNSYVRRACTRINEFGYASSPDDFFTQGYGSGKSIAEVIGTDCSEPAALSRECGFDADTDTRGLVELMLWNIDSDSVMYVWLLDREPQLVFTESISTGLLRPISEKR